MAKSKVFLPPPIEQTGSIARYLAGLRSQDSVTADDQTIKSSATITLPTTQLQKEVTESITNEDRSPAIVSAASTTETNSAVKDTLSQIRDTGATASSDEVPADSSSEHVDKSIAIDASLIPDSTIPFVDVVKQAESSPITAVTEIPIKKQSSGETTSPRKAKAKAEISANSNCELENYIFSTPQAYTTQHYVRGEMKIRITAENAELLKIITDFSDKFFTKPCIADNLVNYLLSNFFTRFSDDLETLTIKQQQRVLEEYQERLSNLKSRK